MKFEKLELNKPIKFEWKTEQWWIAYFSFCPVRKNGIITRVYIQRSQQGTLGGYRIDIPKKYGATSIWFSVYDLPELNVTLDEVEWCDTHKTEHISIHAPRESTTLTVEYAIGKVHVCFRGWRI
jgi:hypothetical protein